MLLVRDAHILHQVLALVAVGYYLANKPAYILMLISTVDAVPRQSTVRAVKQKCHLAQRL